MRPVKKNDSMTETEVTTRIWAGVEALFREADACQLAELYNQVAVRGSGQIAVVEDEGGDLELSNGGEAMFMVTEADEDPDWEA